MLTCSPRPGNKGLEATLTHVLRATTEVTKRPLMQFGPDLLADFQITQQKLARK